MLDYAVYALEVFPNESPNACVFWNRLVGAVVVEVIRSWPFYGNVVDVGYRKMWYFGSEDVCDVVVEDGD